MRKTTTMLFLLFLSPIFASAAINAPFKQGEETTYILKYKLAAKFNVAELTSEITKIDADTGVMTLKGSAHTKGMGNTFYKTKYDMSASMNLETLSALKYIQRGSEEGGKEVKDLQTSCDPKAQTCTISFDRKRKGEQKQNIKNVTESVPGAAQSVLSLIYYVRAAHLPSKEGDSITVPMLFEEDLYSLKITNDGKEEKVWVDGKSYTGTNYIITPTKVKSIDGKPEAPAAPAPVVASEESDKVTHVDILIADDPAKSVTYAATKMKIGLLEIILK